MFKIILKRYKIFHLKINSINDFCIKSTLYFDFFKIKVVYYRDDFIIYNDILNLDDAETERLSNKLYNIFDFVLKMEEVKMEKQELFEKATKAMDNYAKAIEMGLSDFANYFDAKMREHLKEIKIRGLYQEFEDFTLVV